MNSKQHTYDLIRRLKQQPRHGNMLDELNDMTNSAGNFLSTIKNAVGGAVDLFADVSKAYLAMAKDIDKTIASRIGIGKAIELNQALADTYKGLVEPALYFEKRLSVLNKGMGITSKAASNLATALTNNSRAVNETNKAFIPTNEQLLQYSVNIKKMLPTLNQVNVANNAQFKGLQDVQHIMTQNVGLSEDAANSYAQYAAQGDHNAASQLRFTKAFAESLDPHGTIGAFKMITEDIAAAGATTQLQYGRIPGSLERAVMKAKKFGFTLQQVTAVGEKMLDIESSTGDELEYQLLTGRRLVDINGKSLTQKFREAAVTGNAVKSAEALNQIVEQEGKTLEGNLFARKQMSQLLGIDEQQLASAIQKKKILDKMSSKGVVLDIDDEGALAKAAGELARSGDLNESELEEFQKATDTRTTDDILNQQLVLMQEQLMATYLTNANSEEIRNAILDGAKKAQLKNMADMKAEDLKALGSAYATMYTAVQGVTTVKNFATGLMSGAKPASPAVPASGGAPSRAPGGDVVSMPGRTTTLVGDYGEIFLDPRDAVAAGPPAAIAGLMSGNSSGNNADIVRAIADLKNTLVTVMLSRPAEGLNPPPAWA